jgi:ABC-2 type transport system permease protein
LLQSFAYRGEMLVWVLSTTMPLIMLALFTALAQQGPIGRYGAPELTGYYLATFIVRQVTSSWASWQINLDIRDGTMGTRLLRPIHPLLSYGATSVANVPIRAVVAVPVAIGWLVATGGNAVTHDPVVWTLWLASMVGAALLSTLVSFAIGALAFFLESAQKVMDLWLTFYFVLSGYLVPIDLFPVKLRAVVDALPFRFQIGLPVELMIGAHGRAEALGLVLRQWVWVLVLALVVRRLWSRGLERYASFGG